MVRSGARSGPRWSTAQEEEILYRSILRPLLFRLPPEQAHAVAGLALRAGPIWSAADLLFGVRDARLETRVAGIALPNPTGVAAGMDKDCLCLGCLLDLGFGFAVGGTVTLGPRPGNPRPRLLRMPREGALINAMGFPGPGAEAVEGRLRALAGRKARIFISIAGIIEEEVIECYRRLDPLAAAVELNISSPNTAGLRVFHEPARLRGLVEALAAAKVNPLFVKLAPWDREREARETALTLAETAVNAGADGLVVANSRPIVHGGLAVGHGGLSGTPLFETTARMVRDVHAALGGDAVLLASGGVSTAEHAWNLLAAGASATQVYTGLVYEGPGLPGRINRGLLQLMDRAGVAGVEAIREAGVAAPPGS